MGVSCFVIFFLALILPCLEGQGEGEKKILQKRQTKPQPVSVNNPFIQDPSAEQLPIWAFSHPNGVEIRTTGGSGSPVPSNTASLAITNKGPLTMDPILINKLASFNRERIPERVVHAKGQGAFGQFVVTYDVSRYTKAKVFNRIGKVTNVAVRFSNTFGETGFPDTIPDVRGFSLRFYTEDGNLDFVGLNLPIFTIRDPMVFMDVNKSKKRNPQTHLRDSNMAFDFVSLRPEMSYNFLRSYADEARPGSMRAANGFSVNSYNCINSQGELIYCKFSWKSQQVGIPSLSDFETIALAGTDPDHYTKDLYNAIAQGDYPKWTFGFQLMTQDQASKLPYNHVDPTKEWLEEEFPFVPIGVFTLDRNPTDFFTQVEQAAYNPANLVPGISASRDIVLAARLFAYADAQRYRIGPNFEQVEVNRPLSPVNTYQRDGAMRYSAETNGDGGPVYFPNSFNGPLIDPAALEIPLPVSGYEFRVDSGAEDNFSQPKHYLETSVGVEEKARIAMRIATSLAEVIPSVRARVLVNCIYPMGKDFGDLVVKSLQIVETQAANNASQYLHNVLY